MKWLFTAIAVATLATCCAGQTPDFRKTTWGMTKAQVLATEPLKPVIRDDEAGLTVVAYKSVTVAGMTGNLVYIFAEDKLVRAKYMFEEEHSNKTDHITDYETLDDTLGEKYGKPSSRLVRWKDDLYKDEPAKYGFAVSLGHLVYYTKWDQTRTSIIHYLTGENYEISHGIEYVSVELGGLEDKVRQKKSKDAL